MSIKRKIFVTFLGCVVAFDIYGQGTLKLGNRASNQAFCLQGNVSSVLTDALCIKGNSTNVGLGTSSAARQFHIQNSATAYIQLEGTTGTSYAGVEYKNSDKTWTAGIDGSTDNFVLTNTSGFGSSANYILETDKTSNVTKFQNGINVSPAGSGTTMNAFQEGSFTPTISSTTNITSTGTVSFWFQRIGNTVHVFGGLDITPTSANTFTTFVMTVPITATSTISDTRAAGTGVEGDSGTTGVAWVVRGGGDTTHVGVQGFARTTGIKNSKFHYSYRVD